MKIQHYERLMAMQASRRNVLKGAASVGAPSRRDRRVCSALSPRAFAQDNLRAEILKIPGVGAGSPTDADWQKVGELCLGPTKANVAEGEFAGVELTFMGLNNQNLHNVLFRGFLKPWEAYTGAKITWIDLAQADYNPRLQQSIATGTVDFDIVEMGAPFEGDTAAAACLDEMPDWVKQQIETDDLVGYLQPPVGTWDGKTYRIIIDGDCHTFAIAPTILHPTSGGLRRPAARASRRRPGRRCRRFTKKVKGKKDSTAGRLRLPRSAEVPWGGFGYYFIADRAAAYGKHPSDKAWLFDPDTMKPRVNNPAWVKAIQDVMDLMAAGAYPADQVNTDPNGTAFHAVPRRHGVDADLVGRRRLERAHKRQLDRGRRHRVLDHPPGADEVYNSATGAVGEAGRRSELRAEHGLYRLGRLRHQPRVDGDEKKRKAAWCAAAHLGGKDLSLWMAAYPSGFQPYRN